MDKSRQAQRRGCQVDNPISPLRLVTSWLDQIQRADSSIHTICFESHNDSSANTKKYVISDFSNDDDGRTLSPFPGIEDENAGVASQRLVSRYHKADSTTSIPSSEERRPYKKRRRHKTRPDRYDIGESKRNGSREYHKRSSNRRKSLVRRTGGSADVMARFTSNAVADGTKVTVKPKLTTGMFLNGRCSKSRRLSDLSFNRMPFLDQHSEKCGNNNSATLTKKHLLPENDLFGSPKVTKNSEQIIIQEQLPHPRDCVDHKEAQADNEADHAATSRSNTREESSLFVDPPSAEHREGRELPKAGSNEVDNIEVPSGREAPSTESRPLRPRASSESESINALYCSGVFDFDHQMRTSSPNPPKAAANRRQIDSPMATCQQEDLPALVGDPSAVDKGSTCKSQDHDKSNDILPEHFSQHAQQNPQTGLNACDEFGTRTESSHMWTDERETLIPRTAYAMTGSTNERTLSRIQQPATVRSVLWDPEHWQDFIPSAPWHIPLLQPGRDEVPLDGWESLPQHSICPEGQVISLGGMCLRSYNRDTPAFQEKNTMEWCEALQQNHGMGVSPHTEAANTTIEALDRAVEYEAAVDKLRGSWEYLDASTCHENDLQRDFILQERDNISRGTEIRSEFLADYGGMRLKQHGPLGRQHDRGVLDSFWKPRR